MKKMTAILLMLCISSIYQQASAQWEEVTKQDGYFTQLINQDFVLVAFFNPESCSSCQKSTLEQLGSLEQNQFFRDNEINLLYVDTVKTPFFKKHYDLEKPQQLYLFIRNQLVKFEKFNNLMGSQELSQKVENFVKKNVEKIAQEVIQLEGLESLLEEHQILALYMGEQNENYAKFYDLAVHNITVNFFTIFNKNLKERVYQQYSTKDAPENDVLVILRSENLVDNFDKDQMVEFEKFSSKFDMNKFLEFERYPKMRDCQYNHLNVQELFYKRHFMLVYIPAENEDESKLEAFSKSVQFLPKRIIYSKCQFNDKEINHYLHLFLLANMNFSPGSLYMVNVTPSAKVNIKQYTQAFTTEGINNFVFDIYERNKYFFKDPEEVNKKDDIKTSEL